jgi:hypothetical protein
MKISLDAWANDVCWSPSCKTAVVAAQDSTLTFITVADQSTKTLNLESTPIARLIFVDDRTLIGIGYDRHVYQFENVEGNTWYSNY